MILARARAMVAQLRASVAVPVDLAKVRDDIAAARAFALAEQELRAIDVAAAHDFGEPVPIGKAALSDRLAGQPLYAALRVSPGSANALHNWALAQGIAEPVAAGELHITTVYSRTPVPLYRTLDSQARETLYPSGYRLALFGEPDSPALVLLVESDLARSSHDYAVDLGAQFDYPVYRPHITLAYGFTGTMPAEPPPFAIEVGDEFAEPIDAKGDDSAIAKGGFRFGGKGKHKGSWKAGPHGIGKPWEHQERAPKGSADGGKWIKEGSDPSGAVAGGAGWHQAKGPPKKAPEPSDLGDNRNPEDVAVYVAGHDPGTGLNGIDFAPWEGPHLRDFSKIPDAIDEPPYPNPPPQPAWTDPISGKSYAAKPKRLGAGVVIEEPDGRVWLVEPANHFGGYRNTLPKGGQEPGLTLQQTALKEAWEETGLRVRLTGVVGDFEGDTSVARYYRAERIGGSPDQAHWESWAVKLAPKEELPILFNRRRDKEIAAAYANESVSKAAKPGKAMKEKHTKGHFKSAAGHWELQARAPRGTPIAGQWIGDYGHGTYGAKLGVGGHKFVPITIGKGSSNSKSLAAQVAATKYALAANEGPQAFAKIPPPKAFENVSSYYKEQYATYMEAKAYVEAKASAPAQPAKGGVDQPMKLSDLTWQAGKTKGSSQGAIYTDADGSTWLVKSYKPQGMAESEVLASKLYQAAGAGAPEMRIIDLEGQFHGGMGVASKWIEGSHALNDTPLPTAQIKAMAGEDFAADAWLNNWDAVGLDFDNIVSVPGKGGGWDAVRIDPGGALEWRAQGLKKPLGLTADAFDTLRDPKINAQAAQVFGELSASQLKASIDKVAAVDSGTIIDLVGKYAPGTTAEKIALANKLVARRNDLIARGEKLLPTPQEALDNPAATKPVKAGIAAPIAQETAQAAAKTIPADLDSALPAHPEFGYGTQDFYNGKVGELHDAVDAAKASGDWSDAEALAAWKPKSETGQNSPNAKAYNAYAGKFMAFHKADSAKAMAAETVGPLLPPTVHPDPASPPPLPEPIDLSKIGGHVSKKAKADLWNIQHMATKIAAGGKSESYINSVKNYISKTTFPKTTPLGIAATKYKQDVLAAIGGHNPAVKPTPAVQTAAATIAAETIKAAPPANLGKASPEHIKSYIPDPPHYSSSKPHKDAHNKASLKLIHETALAGDMKALDALTLDTIDIQTGAVTGKILARDYPSGPVQKYYHAASQGLYEALLPPPPPPKAASASMVRLAKQAGPAKFHTVKEAKAAGFEVLGRWAVMEDLGVPDYGALELPIMSFRNNSTQYEKMIAQMKAHSKKMYDSLPYNQKDALEHHKGTGYSETGHQAAKGIKHDNNDLFEYAIKKNGFLVPPGAVIGRKIPNIDQGETGLLSALHKGHLNGRVLQEMAGVSGSWDPDYWNGTYHLKLTAAPGVRLFYAKGIVKANSGESEIMIPPRSRYLIRSVTKNTGKKDADGFPGSGTSWLIDALLLPNEHDVD